MNRIKLQLEAAAVADEMMRLGKDEEPLHGVQRTRGLPPALRERFVNVRASLIGIGIFDPVLARFDSYTVAQETSAVIGRQLAALAESLA